MRGIKRLFQIILSIYQIDLLLRGSIFKQKTLTVTTLPGVFKIVANLNGKKSSIYKRVEI